MKNKQKKTEEDKKQLTPEQQEQQEQETMELLQRSSETKGKQLQFDTFNVLMQYLPSDKSFEKARKIIYDEKNVFLNRGKKKSDNNGIRKSDGRMTYQPVMNEMVDLIVKWASTSQNPFTLYNALYELNEKHGYGHEEYDPTTINYANAMRKLKETE